MATSFKRAAADVPSLRCGKGLHAELDAAAIARGDAAMQVAVEGT